MSTPALDTNRGRTSRPDPDGDPYGFPPRGRLRSAFLLVLALFLVELALTVLSTPLLVGHVQWNEPDEMFIVGLQLLLARFVGANHVLLLLALWATGQGVRAFSLTKVTLINVAVMFGASLVFAVVFGLFMGQGGRQVLSTVADVARVLTTVKGELTSSPLMLFAPAFASPAIVLVASRLLADRGRIAPDA